jgi:hypothetical protein
VGEELKDTLRIKRQTFKELKICFLCISFRVLQKSKKICEGSKIKAGKATPRLPK